MDVLIVNLNEPPSLLRNDLRGKQNWIKVKLEGVKSNRSAIGARVLARYGGKTQAQAVLSQSSFYSANDPRLHFGLGSFTSVDLDVHWPNGLHETFKQIAANQLITLREGRRTRAKPWLVQVVAGFGSLPRTRAWRRPATISAASGPTPCRSFRRSDR